MTWGLFNGSECCLVEANAPEIMNTETETPSYPPTLSPYHSPTLHTSHSPTLPLFHPSTLPPFHPPTLPSGQTDVSRQTDVSGQFQSIQADACIRASWQCELSGQGRFCYPGIAIYPGSRARSLSRQTGDGIYPGSLARKPIRAA